MYSVSVKYGTCSYCGHEGKNVDFFDFTIDEEDVINKKFPTSIMKCPSCGSRDSWIEKTSNNE